MSTLYTNRLFLNGNKVKQMYINGSKVYQLVEGTAPVPPTPTPYEEQYLTFDIISGGTVNWLTARVNNQTLPLTISYSINNGSWTSITSSTAGTSFNVSAGDKIRFKGTNNAYANSLQYNTFKGSSAIFDVVGNIMSLIYGDNFIGQTVLTESNTFYYLFRESKIRSAENLILPATTLRVGCYNNMFASCNYLTIAPKLPATTLTGSCYSYMFYNCTSLLQAPELLASITTGTEYIYMFNGCTNLNYIKCLTTNPGNGFSVWLKDVAATGTFVKAAGITWPAGMSGIPVGWTVQDAS